MFAAIDAKTAGAMCAYRCPRYAQLPDIPLYRDQVLDALERYTAPFFAWEDEAPLTAAMINNYVKQRLIAPPVKKRYEREQIAQLYCICLLKQVMRVGELHALFALQARCCALPEAYDLFCEALEQALCAAFSGAGCAGGEAAETPGRALVRALAQCVANRLFTLKFLEAQQTAT